MQIQGLIVIIIMSTFIPTHKSHNSLTTKKQRTPINDENTPAVQTNRSNNSKINHAAYHSVPLNHLPCSINLNQQVQQQTNQKYGNVQTTPRQSSSRTDMQKNSSIPFDRTNNLLAMIDKKQVIGKGGFGKVWKVELRGYGKYLALKQMSKALVISKKSVPSVMNQKQLLVSLQNIFLVNLLQAHQDRQNLYLILDYLPGGDLRHHLSRRRFNEEEAKFIIICIVLGLKYLHGKGVIHRDIKPENIVLDKNGYARITDLGVARPFRPNNSSDTSGTPGYMAPEVLCRQNHSFSVDFFALGVIAHELMLRRRPFQGRSRKQIREQILARQVQIKKHQIPDDWSLQSADFINRLLQRKPAQRLGGNSVQQIIRHPWLRNFPIDRVATRNLQAPWHPDPHQPKWDENDLSSEQTQMQQLVAQNELMLRNEQVQQLFDGYDYHRQNLKFS